MIFECTDYRTYLKGVLVERIKKNPSYSLRAFSKQIGISASMLSEVLKGEKNLSSEKASTIASHLELSNNEESYFLGLVQLETTNDVQQKEKIIVRLNQLAPNRNIRDLSIDHFHSVANWVCAAGMALLSTSAKGLSADQIAKRLGITAFEASEAMERWMRLDFIKFTGKNYIRIDSDHILMKSNAPNGALRKFHSSMLDKAKASLETQNNQEKYLGSETIAVDSKNLDSISKVIEDAVAKILKISKESKCKNEVYHLGFQFFRLTQKENKK